MRKPSDVYVRIVHDGAAYYHKNLDLDEKAVNRAILCILYLYLTRSNEKYVTVELAKHLTVESGLWDSEKRGLEWDAEAVDSRPVGKSVEKHASGVEVHHAVRYHLVMACMQYKPTGPLGIMIQDEIPKEKTGNLWMAPKQPFMFTEAGVAECERILKFVTETKIEDIFSLRLKNLKRFVERVWLDEVALKDFFERLIARQSYTAKQGGKRKTLKAEKAAMDAVEDGDSDDGE